MITKDEQKMNPRSAFHDTFISDHGPMQNETPEETGKERRTVRVAPFWEQNQPVLLIAAPDGEAAGPFVAACRNLGIKTHLVHSGAAALIAYGRFAPDAVVIGGGLADLLPQTLSMAVAEDTAANAGDGGGCPVLQVKPEGTNAPEAGSVTWVVDSYEDVMSTPMFTALVDRSKKPRPDNEELAYGSLVMRPTAFEVTDAGNPVVLTLREFELLRILLLGRGQTVTLSRLKTEVWGVVEEEVRTDTLKAHMNRLRKKLSGPTKPVAVRGIGYCLKDTAPA